jgi:hypothetical protein
VELVDHRLVRRRHLLAEVAAEVAAVAAVPEDQVEEVVVDLAVLIPDLAPVP